VRHSPCCLIDFLCDPASVMHQCQKRNLKFEMHNCKLQVERLNSLLAHDNMRDCYHGCVRGVRHITAKHHVGASTNLSSGSSSFN